MDSNGTRLQVIKTLIFNHPAQRDLLWFVMASNWARRWLQAKSCGADVMALSDARELE